MADLVNTDLDSSSECNNLYTQPAYSKISNLDSTDALVGAYTLYWQALNSPSASDPSYDFSGLGLQQIPTAVTESQDGKDLAFYSACP